MTMFLALGTMQSVPQQLLPCRSATRVQLLYENSQKALLSPRITLPAQGVDKKRGRGSLRQSPPRNTLDDGYTHTRFVQSLMTLPTPNLYPDPQSHTAQLRHQLLHTTPSPLLRQPPPPTPGHRSDQKSTPLTQAGPAPGQCIPHHQPP